VLHLIHPVFVHVTVSFLIVGGLVEVFGIARRRDGAERFGGLLVVLGTASLVPTLVAGFLAENSLTLGQEASEAVADHERLGLLAFGVFLPLLLMKAWGRGRPPARWRGHYAAGVLVGVGLTVAAAYQGGFMVYELGVGVAGP
jgi:uncharacterized membrane protein